MKFSTYFYQKVSVWIQHHYWQSQNIYRVLTGDALLIRGCGRTDFQGGDAGTLYDSVTIAVAQFQLLVRKSVGIRGLLDAIATVLLN